MPSDQIPLEIVRNPIFYPYFKDVIGAIDGTHIKAHVAADSVAPFRNKKGDISQNVMAACTFDMYFCFVLPGWKGSAHDGRVLNNALMRGKDIPAGKYYLTDAGYALKKGFLVPYGRVRYHLGEQFNSRQK